MTGPHLGNIDDESFHLSMAHGFCGVRITPTIKKMVSNWCEVYLPLSPSGDNF